ncbi:MAG TPA: sigma-70 family RNA polymerase sigma factor [Gemmataceae bacterium]|nr:sigma-70 family RNA polymerase sigma factor [Gemmataceae bacterium]
MNRLLLHLNRILRAAAAHSDGQLLARFIEQRDEEAFRLLVERHGPLVRGVCRRWLPNPADRDDAFQATFLVLARKAKSISQPERLSSWLHSVALRTSRKLRFNLDRRQRLEELRAQLPEAAISTASPTSDLARLLDEELARLPEKYRQSVLLCHVQGLSRREAASRLEIPEGTLSTWLNQARLLLRKRLVRRGIVPVVALPLLAAEADAVPPELLRATVQAAVSFTHQTAMAAASAAVVRLAQGVLRMLLVKRITAASAALFLVFFLGAGIGLFLNEQARKPSFAADPPKPTGKTDGLQVQVFESGNKLPQITVVEKEDRITVNTVAALGRYLKRLRTADKTLPDSITIVSNADTKYSTMAEVLLVCKEAGFGVHVAAKFKDVTDGDGLGKNSDQGISGSVAKDKWRIDLLTRLEDLQQQRDVLLAKLREMEGLGKSDAATDPKAEVARLRAERDRLEAMLRQAEAKNALGDKALPQLPGGPAKTPPRTVDAAYRSALIEEAKTDAAILQAAIQAAKADAESAKYTAEYYQIQMEKTKELHKKGGTTAQEVRKAELEYQRSKTDIDFKLAQLKKAEAEWQREKARLDILMKGGPIPEKNKTPTESPAAYDQALKDYQRALAENSAKLDQAKQKELDEQKAKHKTHIDELIKDYDRAIAEMAIQLDKSKLQKLAEPWPAATRKELEPFQGVWKVTEQLFEGKAPPGPNQPADHEWIVLDDNVMLIYGDKPRMGKIQLSSKDGKPQLSITYSTEAGPITAAGTYEFEGGKLKLTLATQSSPNSAKPAIVTITLQRRGDRKDYRTDAPGIPKVYTPFPVLPPDKNTDAELRVAKAEAELLAARADLKAAEANFKTSQLKLDRMAKLSEAKAVEAKLVDEAKVQVESAQAAVEAAQAKVKIAEVNLAAEKDNLKRANTKQVGGPQEKPLPVKP